VAESRSGRFEPFVETEGLKVNAHCLVEAGGRLYAGTDGRGLYRLSLDRRRFERLDAPLPSQHVTALLADEDELYVGTDEGLTRLALEPQTQDHS
jgi:ligand-binding sensor domain-containing protein